MIEEEKISKTERTMISRNKKMKKITLEEAQRLKEEMERQAPGKKFIFNPDVVQMPPLNLSVSSILDAAIKRLGDVIQKNPDIKDAEFAKTVIMFPVREPGNTKKNRARLVDGDNSSPMGIITKRDMYAIMRYKPYAGAQFIARDVMKWASEKVAIEEAAKEKADLEKYVVKCDETVEDGAVSGT